MSEPILVAKNIRKSFPGIQAVDGVDLTILPGEIIGLVGKNGAGKSTLIKMLAGAQSPDSGVFLVDGVETTLDSPEESHRAGLAFMHQELELIPGMSVAENVALGRNTPRRGGVFVNWKKLRSDVEVVVKDLDPTIDLDDDVDTLTVVQQRLVMIARALYRQARVLVLDEPTASLTTTEIEHLHTVCRRLRDTGGSIVYVSHRLDEIFALTDRVVVMRDGKHVTTDRTENLDRRSMIKAITGSQVGRTATERRSERPRREFGEVVLATERLSRRGKVEDVSVSVRSGEILGIAGLVGAGRTELARMLFGADSATSGSVLMHGATVRLNGPRDAIAAGIALLPEDRRNQGLFLDFSVRENSTIAALTKFSRGAFPSRHRERKATEISAQGLSMAIRSVDQKVRFLSGGTQQKVVLSKWLEVDADLLIFDEPTAGIDVDARAQIYELMEDLAARGKALLFISSDFSELVGVCDRVAVMQEGRLISEIPDAEITEAAIVERCYAELTHSAAPA